MRDPGIDRERRQQQMVGCIERAVWILTVFYGFTL
jgi:hypothetical protein